MGDMTARKSRAAVSVEQHRRPRFDQAQGHDRQQPQHAGHCAVRKKRGVRHYAPVPISPADLIRKRRPEIRPARRVRRLGTS